MLAVLYLLALGALVAFPATAYLREEGRAAAGARQMATTFQALRWKSVSMRRACGLFFERQGDRWVWWLVVDGNGNGLRTAEVRAGVDPIRSGPHGLDDHLEHVALGFPPRGGPFPQIPRGPGNISGTDDPIQFGRSDLVSFTPGGSSSSGTLYVTDGQKGLFGVVLFGPTSKLRVWRYNPRERRWIL